MDVGRSWAACDCRRIVRAHAVPRWAPDRELAFFDVVYNLLVNKEERLPDIAYFRPGGGMDQDVYVVHFRGAVPPCRSFAKIGFEDDQLLTARMIHALPSACDDDDRMTPLEQLSRQMPTDKSGAPCQENAYSRLQ